MQNKKIDPAALLAFVVTFNMLMNEYKNWTKQDFINAANVDGFEPEVVQTFETLDEANKFIETDKNRVRSAKKIDLQKLLAFVVIFNLSLNEYLSITKEEYQDEEYKDGYYWEVVATFNTNEEALVFIKKDTTDRAAKVKNAPKVAPKPALNAVVILFNEDLKAHHYCTKEQYLAAKAIPGYNWEVVNSVGSIAEAEKVIDTDKTKRAAAEKVEFDKAVAEEKRRR